MINNQAFEQTYNNISKMYNDYFEEQKRLLIDAKKIAKNMEIN